jgi:ATP-dependent DNA helicase DinG
MKSHRLIDLVKAFDAPLSTHRADEDVTATCALYRILLAAVDLMPIDLVHVIAGLATPDEWSTGKVFAYFVTRANLDGVPRFSLKALRKDRTCKFELKAKVDAGTMISAELAEKTGIRFDENNGEGFKKLEFPTVEEVSAAFGEDGAISRLYDDYQYRQEQLDMAVAVRNSFAISENLAVEAGTGVGKSMAYLVPAALTALKNNITVGVATKTNALLDQLVYKELPALKSVLGDELTYVSLKGYSHYPCLLKTERIVNEGAKLCKVQDEVRTQAPSIAALLSFVNQTDYDDMDNLKLDYRVLPRYAVTTTSHECMKRKCPFYGTGCFVHGSRRLAENSHIVVTNHSLLFCDVAADNGLLPPVRYWVIDEAHNAEGEARRALSLELSVEELNSLADRVSSSSATKNPFLRAERVALEPKAGSAGAIGKPGASLSENPAAKAGNEDYGTLFYALTSKAKTAGVRFKEAEQDFASQVRSLLYFDTQKRNGYESVDLWINQEMRQSEVFAALRELAKPFIEAAEKLVNACQELVGFMDDAAGASAVEREIAAIAYDLKDAIKAADEIFFKATEMYVYSASLSRKAERGRNSLRAELFNVGSMLCETLYSTTHSCIFASATMTVDGSFKPFEDSMGLNIAEQSKAQFLALESCYDFDKNMVVYIPNDLPEPNTAGYLPALKEMLAAVHVANGGSILTLFTNKKEMEDCYAAVNPAVKDADLRLICQKWGVSVKSLRDEFIEDKSVSLFALKSFWEGFDAPGSTLRGVVIPKLPFQKPSDPLSCERAARDDYAWRNYVLPQAVLEVRQAVGRLIRKAEDRGIVVFGDVRLVSKGYGRVFVKSLPTKNVKIMPVSEIVKDIEANLFL